jgi:hypothetical protein
MDHQTPNEVRKISSFLYVMFELSAKLNKVSRVEKQDPDVAERDFVGSSEPVAQAGDCVCSALRCVEPILDEKRADFGLDYVAEPRSGIINRFGWCNVGMSNPELRTQCSVGRDFIIQFRQSRLE